VSGVPPDVGQERRIPVPGTLNLRDVGGYRAAGNTTTRWHTLLRSDALHLIDDSGVAVLAEYGLSTVIDLRTEAEIRLAPSARGGIAATTVRVGLLCSDLDTSPRQLAAIYRYLINERGDAIAEAIKHLCRPGSVPALVHCSAGKDRTGIVIALVLAVLGVPDEIVAADYALTASFLNTEAAIGQLRVSVGLDDRLTPELLASPAALILEVLTWVRQANGSVKGYLVAHGVTPAELDSLRAALTH
jgi:protein-tyrosine phosphatase